MFNSSSNWRSKMLYLAWKSSFFPVTKLKYFQKNFFIFFYFYPILNDRTFDERSSNSDELEHLLNARTVVKSGA